MLIYFQMSKLEINKYNVNFKLLHFFKVVKGNMQVLRFWVVKLYSLLFYLYLSLYFFNYDHLLLLSSKIRLIFFFLKRTSPAQCSQSHDIFRCYLHSEGHTVVPLYTCCSLAPSGTGLIADEYPPKWETREWHHLSRSMKPLS